MAGHAIDLGYEYMAVTDHSHSLVIANGLDVESLKEQVRLLRTLNEDFGGRFYILAGVEVDILKDGSLDYPDEVLAELDIVVASLHSGFRQGEEQLTERLIAAMKNPHVDIIGHPTGRILGYRHAYPLDVEQIFRWAGETGTALEINASPDRLDLGSEYIRMAREFGVKFAINSDAHSPPAMDLMEYGVLTARRGWLSTEEVLNCWELTRLLHYLGQR
jgi:DNA polymerase (family 10)